MKFSHSCFVKIRDSFTRNKAVEALEKMGYRKSANYAFGRSHTISVTADTIFRDSSLDMLRSMKQEHLLIDCMESTEAFMDVAAIRTDVDKNQLFVVNGEYLRCEYDQAPLQWKMNGNHKATPEEIIQCRLIPLSNTLVKTDCMENVLKIGDYVYFKEEVQRYKVVALSHRFAILTKPFNAMRTVLYTIIDFTTEERGPHNLIFNLYDFEDKNDMETLLNDLDNNECSLSRRKSIPLTPFKIKSNF